MDIKFKAKFYAMYYAYKFGMKSMKLTTALGTWALYTAAQALEDVIEQAETVWGLIQKVVDDKGELTQEEVFGILVRNEFNKEETNENTMESN